MEGVAWMFAGRYLDKEIINVLLFWIYFTKWNDWVYFPLYYVDSLSKYNKPRSLWPKGLILVIPKLMSIDTIIWLAIEIGKSSFVWSSMILKDLKNMEKSIKMNSKVGKVFIVFWELL